MLDRIRTDGNKVLQTFIVDTFASELEKSCMTTSFIDLRERISAFRLKEEEFSLQPSDFQTTETFNTFTEEASEEKYFGSPASNQDKESDNASQSEESESKRRKFELQYDNIFLGCNFTCIS